jgi:hypothetical protein
MPQIFHFVKCFVILASFAHFLLLFYSADIPISGYSGCAGFFYCEIPF